jgi:hypothetical protein
MITDMFMTVGSGLLGLGVGSMRLAENGLRCPDGYVRIEDGAVFMGGDLKNVRVKHTTDLTDMRSNQPRMRVGTEKTALELEDMEERISAVGFEPPEPEPRKWWQVAWDKMKSVTEQLVPEKFKSTSKTYEAVATNDLADAISLRTESAEMQLGDGRLLFRSKWGQEFSFRSDVDEGVNAFLVAHNQNVLRIQGYKDRGAFLTSEQMIRIGVDDLTPPMVGNFLTVDRESINWIRNDKSLMEIREFSDGVLIKSKYAERYFGELIELMTPNTIWIQKDGVCKFSLNNGIYIEYNGVAQVIREYTKTPQKETTAEEEEGEAREVWEAEDEINTDWENDEDVELWFERYPKTENNVKTTYFNFAAYDLNIKAPKIFFDGQTPQYYTKAEVDQLIGGGGGEAGGDYVPTNGGLVTISNNDTQGVYMQNDSTFLSLKYIITLQAGTSIGGNLSQFQLSASGIHINTSSIDFALSDNTFHGYSAFAQPNQDDYDTWETRPKMIDSAAVKWAIDNKISGEAGSDYVPTNGSVVTISNNTDGVNMQKVNGNITFALKDLIRLEAGVNTNMAQIQVSSGYIYIKTQSLNFVLSDGYQYSYSAFAKCTDDDFLTWSTSTKMIDTKSASWAFLPKKSSSYSGSVTTELSNNDGIFAATTYFPSTQRYSRIRTMSEMIFMEVYYFDANNIEQILTRYIQTSSYIRLYCYPTYFEINSTGIKTNANIQFDDSTTITHKTDVSSPEKGRFCEMTGEIYDYPNGIDTTDCICKVKLATEISNRIVGIITADDKFASHGDVLVIVDEEYEYELGDLLVPTQTGSRPATADEKMTIMLNGLPRVRVSSINTPKINDKNCVACFIS